ncbi:Crp/Fnr family transcriptional regulator [Rhizosphaericola mali]|nr:Crp/Fnr family transcriptional regulator [Rhizosphaericola mali]
MQDVFTNYLKSQVDISDAELAEILQLSINKTIKKSQSILHDGETWRFMCFITKGCCRLYRFDEKGMDHTVRFGIENWWMTDQQSYNLNIPSEYNIEAITQSSLLLWRKEDWENLIEKIPALKQFYTVLSARAYEAGLQRIFSLISKTAEERYSEFQINYPTIFNKVPLYMVASYLGISRETLSRIRKNATII